MVPYRPAGKTGDLTQDPQNSPDVCTARCRVRIRTCRRKRTAGTVGSSGACRPPVCILANQGLTEGGEEVEGSLANLKPKMMVEYGLLAPLSR